MSSIYINLEWQNIIDPQAKAEVEAHTEVDPLAAAEVCPRSNPVKLVVRLGVRWACRLAAPSDARWVVRWVCRLGVRWACRLAAPSDVKLVARSAVRWAVNKCVRRKVKKHTSNI